MDIGEIVISDETYQEIISVIGYPILDPDEEDFEYTKEQIITFAIRPAMREYFKWFPKTFSEDFQISQTFSIPFPNDETYTAKNIRVNKNSLTTGTTGNPLINSRVYKVDSQMWQWNSRYHYNMNRALNLEIAENQSQIGFTASIRHEVDKINRVVHGYSNVLGRLSITWCQVSNNFDDVNYSRIDELIKLCQGKLMLKIGMIRGQQNNNTPVDFNFDMFISEGKEYEKEVMEGWKNFSKVAMYKN